LVVTAQERLTVPEQPVRLELVQAALAAVRLSPVMVAVVVAQRGGIFML
jgi:hypothetical protein